MTGLAAAGLWTHVHFTLYDFNNIKMANFLQSVPNETTHLWWQLHGKSCAEIFRAVLFHVPFTGWYKWNTRRYKCTITIYFYIHYVVICSIKLTICLIFMLWWYKVTLMDFFLTKLINCRKPEKNHINYWYLWL